MTLSSRHRIRNSSPGGLRPSTLPLGHKGSPQYWLSHVDGEETFLFLQTAETGNRTPNSDVKVSGANHYPRAPAQRLWHMSDFASDVLIGYFWSIESYISATETRPTLIQRLWRILDAASVFLILLRGSPMRSASHTANAGRPLLNINYTKSQMYFVDVDYLLLFVCITFANLTKRPIEQQAYFKDAEMIK